MGFHFRRSARLGPLRFNFGKGGLSALHDGGDGTSFNILVRRIDYPPPPPVGLPGTMIVVALLVGFLGAISLLLLVIGHQQQQFDQ